MLTLTELIATLRKVFAKDEVNVPEVMRLMKLYRSNRAEWNKYAVFDKHKYTRNLVDVGNGKYNLMALCWGPGMGSSIHDHADAHCFVKILDGSLTETKYGWPENTGAETQLEKLEQTRYEENGVTYMSDKLGLHRMENLSHSDGAVSLHLYIPAFDCCSAFDERTGKRVKCSMSFYTKYGAKMDQEGTGVKNLVDYGETVINTALES